MALENITVLESSIDKLTSNIEFLEERMSKLDKTSKDYADDAKELANLQKQLADVTKKQNDETKELDNTQKKTTKTVADWADSFKDLKEQLRQNEQALKAMSAAGLNGTKEFRDLAQQIGTMKDAIADASATTRQYADDAMAIKDVIAVTQAATASYGAYTSAMDLLGIKSESTEKIMKRFAQVQQLLNSLSTLQTTLTDKNSAVYRIYTTVMDKLNKTKKTQLATSKEATAATTTEATSTTGLATAEGVATGTTGALTTALHALKGALIATGIGAIVVLIGTLISSFVDTEAVVTKVSEAFGWLGNKVTDAWHALTDFLGITSEEERAAEAAAEAERKRAEAVKRTEDNIKSAAAASMKSNSETIGQLLQLEQKINDVKTSEEERIAAMSRANEVAGKEIYNLKESTNQMANNSNAIKTYIQNLAKEAELKVILTKLGETYIKILKLEELQKTEGLGPGNTAILKQLREEAALYENMAAKVAGQIKIYNDYKSVKDNTTKATKESSKASSEAAKKIAEEQKQREKDEEAIKKWMDSYEKMQAKKTKYDEETYTFDNTIAELNKTMETDLRLHGKTEEEKAAITEKYRQIEEQLTADHNKRLADIKIEETDNTYKRILDEIVTKYQQQEFDMSIDYQTKARDSKMEAARQEYSEEELQAGTETDEYKMAEAEWDAKIELARQKQAELNQAINEMKENLGSDVESSEQYQKMMEERDALNQEILQQEQDMQDELTDIQLEGAESRRVSAENEKKNTIKIYQAATKAVSNLLGGIADINQKKIDKLKDGNEEEKEEARKLWEQNKKIQIAQATVDTLSGAVQAFSGAMSLGPIAGPIVGAINAASVIAAGSENINAIQDQKWDGDSKVGSASTGRGTAQVSIPTASPILDENADLANIQYTRSLDETGDTRVYVTESDITDTQNKVKTRETNSVY